MKRTGKFYRKNEAEVMEDLGLKATMNSGSGWIEKEDGQSDAVICQLKSTDASSIKINQRDLHILEYNAAVAKKIPVFAIQFLNDSSVYLMVKPEDLSNIGEYLKSGKTPNMELFDIQDVEDIKPKKSNKVIKSSKSAREQLQNERELKFKKEKSAT